MLECIITETKDSEPVIYGWGAPMPDESSDFGSMSADQLRAEIEHVDGIADASLRVA